MASPISHLIAVGLLVWWGRWLFRVNPSPAGRRGAALLLGLLSGWVVVSTGLAYRGMYRAHNDPWMLVAWGSAAPFALVAASVLASTSARVAIGNFIFETPLPALIRIHTIRVLALGTILKWWTGALPTHFIVPVAIPDFAVGLSAWFVASGVERAPARWRTWALGWNGVGAYALLAALVLMQLSQPGPLQRFREGPNTDEVLGFPMSIVPTFIGPFFVALHALVFYRLRRRRAAER